MSLKALTRIASFPRDCSEGARDTTADSHVLLIPPSEHSCGLQPMSHIVAQRTAVTPKPDLVWYSFAFVTYCNTTNYPKPSGLKQRIFISSLSVGQESGSSSAGLLCLSLLQGCNDDNSWSSTEAEGIAPKFTYVAVGRELHSFPHHMGFSIGTATDSPQVSDKREGHRQRQRETKLKASVNFIT